jgi:transcriptional regulator with XRE-family HTH domain
MPGGHGSRADNLRAQRNAAGLTGDGGLTGLAAKANVSVQLLKRLEDGGTAMPHEIQRIADALGISTSTLGKKDLF